MITVPVGTTGHIYGSSENGSVVCYWNGSDGTVYTHNNGILPSSTTSQGNITIDVTALGEGSGEVHCISTCRGLEPHNTSNSIIVTVTGKHILLCMCTGENTCTWCLCVRARFCCYVLNLLCQNTFSLAISNIKYMKLTFGICPFLYSEVQTSMTSTLGPMPSTSSGTCTCTCSTTGNTTSHSPSGKLVRIVCMLERKTVDSCMQSLLGVFTYRYNSQAESPSIHMQTHGLLFLLPQQVC